MEINNKYIFHIHTYRCGHASNESDEAYVRKAIELGAESITFTDHTPFPGDTFTGRMKYCQLDEYLLSLSDLKQKYAGAIDVHIGLEVEYMPSFRDYYKELKENDNIELMILGQHHYEISKGIYSFMEKPEQEYVGLVEAMLEGLDMGVFDVVAHPDRAFKKETVWSERMSIYSRKLIEAAGDSIYLEKNYSSMRKKGIYREEFWKLVNPNTQIIYGCDAHSTEEMIIT